MATSKSSRTEPSRTGKASPARKPARVHSSPTSPARTAGPTRPAAERQPAADRRTAAKPEQAEQAGPRWTQLAPPWLQWTTFVLSIAGLGVSAYLVAEHFQGGAVLGCAENGRINCTKVTTSAQSWVWVIPHHWAIPVSVLGLAFFLFLVPIMSPWAWRATDHIGARRIPPTLIPRIRLASLIIGIVFVLYLIYAELHIINSICLYCTSVHIMTFLLFALTVVAAAMWGLNPARDAS